MSHHALQKVVVRMLFDEAFVASIHADPDQALAGLDLSDAERNQLLRVDRRAWRYDPLRRRRTLRTLVEEFKISTTILLAETRSLASLDRFFSSPVFHRSIESRGSLALAFSEFLLEGCRSEIWKSPQIADVARLEAAMVACRRAIARMGFPEPSDLPEVINDRTLVQLRPGYDVASFQGNVIETIQAVERYLFELSLMPAMALCDDAPQLQNLPPVNAQKKSYLLFGPGAAGITLTDLDKTTFLILYEAKRPVEIRTLLARPGLPKGGADRVQEILSEWLEQGTLGLVG